MASTLTRNNIAYGLYNGLQSLAPLPITNAKRDPLGSDKAALATIWCNTVTNAVWVLPSITNNVANWVLMETGGGMGSFASLTVTPGPTAITGLFTLTAGTNTASFANDAADHSTNVGSSTGTSATQIFGGSGGILLAGVAGTPITIGLATQTSNITLGSSTAASSVLIGNGVNTAAQITSIQNGASAGDATVNILSGTATAGVSTVNIGNGNYAKTVNIATGTLGNTVNVATGINSVAQTVNISNGASAAASTVNVLSGAGTAGASLLHLGDNPAVTTITVGNSLPLASRTTTVSGTAITTAVADTINIGTGGVNTSAGASKVVNIATGALLLGTQTVNIATGTAASGTQTVNVGNADDLTAINLRGTILAPGTLTVSGLLQGSSAVATPQLQGVVAGALTVGTETHSAASATATLAFAGTVGTATFTGFTTAAAGTQVFIITNASYTTASQVIASASNLGTNDARMTMARIQQKAGSIEFTLVNNGAAALNGNVAITFWVLQD